MNRCIALLLGCVLLLTACGTDDTTTDAVTPAITTEPTVAITETPSLADAPRPLTPADNAVFDTAWNVVLDWEWFRFLDDGEFYDVRVWRPGEPNLGITWVTTSEMNLSAWLQGQQPGEFLWSVTAIAGEIGADGNGTLTGTISADSPIRRFSVADTSPPPDPDQLLLTNMIREVPPGFRVELFYDGPANPSVITFGPDDLLYVMTQTGQIYTLNDDATMTMLFDNADSLLNQSVGMAFREGVMYVSDSGRISTFTDSDDDDLLDALTPIVEDLPSWLYWAHSNNGIVFGPDDKLYVGIGSTTDHGPLNPAYPLEASVLRMNPDGSDLEVFATGFRNPYDLAFSPDGDLFGVDNNPDVLDETLTFLPPEELNHIQAGGDYGFPHTYGDIAAPDTVTVPVVSFLPSVASSGLIYYPAIERDTAFPETYQDGLFVAHWGSGTEKNINHGHMVAFVRLEPESDTFSGTWESFLSFDFNQPASRPVDVTIGPEGALYVAEYQSGAILRINYIGGDDAVIEGMPASDTADTPSDDELMLDPELVAAGEVIYINGAAGVPNCVACHVASGEDSPLAPGLISQLDRLAARDDSLTVREYVRQSILRPNDYVVDGYNAGVMYQDYAANLTEAQVNAVVEYVLSIAGR